MSIFRSEKMSKWQIVLQTDATYQCVSELGELGIVQFEDLNPGLTAFQRQFSREVRRCDDMERQLRYVEAQINLEKIKINELDVLPKAPQPREMIDLEAALSKMESELKEINVNAEALTKNYLSLIEMKLTLKHADVFLGENKLGSSNEVLEFTKDEHDTPDDAVAQQNAQRFKFVTGVIDLEKAAGFERMLWRASRGNVFLRMAPVSEELVDPITGKTHSKAVFIAFYQGDQLKSRVKKICEGYHASLYPCPEATAQRRETTIGVLSRIEDLRTVLNQTKEHRRRVLQSAAKHVRSWTIKVRKMKGVYHTMNMFNIDVSSKALVAECWIPDYDVESVHQTLTSASSKCEGSVPPIVSQMQTKESPPTYFRTNKFTKGFQTLVDSYGMATYREVNPGLYTIITFPFLFAVMFGDAGHGLFVTIFALYMVIKEESLAKIKGEIFGIIFGGRYIILLMGVFSMYTGMIYNDIFAKSFNIFGSAWRVNISNEILGKESHFMLDPKLEAGNYRNDPYPFGLDPVWVVSENKIVYLNSYKMKLSIILGVFHMTFGVFLNLWNFTYFKRNLSIVLEFLPRVLFFWPLFGYLMSLMFLKWVKYGANMETRELQSDCAPSILITFINMMLLSYSEEKLKPPNPECKTVFMYGEGDTQKTVQIVFLLVAVLSVPVLLFGTPLQFLYNQKKQARKASYGSSSGSTDPEMPIVSSESVKKGSSAEDDEHGGAFGDVMIYQAIHTIEYVLESISHTASYLRLWALSLAHSQLSEVLWFMVLRQGFKVFTGYGGSAVLFLVFGFWAGATVAILIGMEGMSAFLHTLRLHWVEFQSKFYKGEGKRFHAFHFRRIEDAKEE